MQNETAKTENATLAVVALATCLALVVFTMPLTALDAMTESLGLSPGGQAWVMSGMPLGAAAGLLTAGAFGDSRGRKETFNAGLWITAASSAVAALAPNGAVLILARLVQGLGSAGIMACGLGLIGQMFFGERRKFAAAIWAAALGAGVAAGPILISLLLHLGGWRSGHWLVAIASAVLALAAIRALPESPKFRKRVDIIGSVLLMGGLGALLSAMTEVRFGLTGLVSGLAVIAVLLLVAFVFFERRIDNPILQITLFRRADFAGATVAAFASGSGILALMTMVPTVLERGFGVNPLLAAFILLPWSSVTVFSALGANYLPKTLSSRSRVLLSMGGCLAAQLLLLLLAADAFWAMALPGLFLAGIANGILNASLGHAAVESVPAERAAMGSAANNTARYLGSAIGIAISSILISSAGTPGLFTGWREAVLVTSGFTLLGMVLMALMHRHAAATA